MFGIATTVRWRIALLCAGLTMLILITFAAVLGTLLTNRIESDRAQELRRSAREIAGQIELRSGRNGVSVPAVEVSNLPSAPLLDGAVYRVIDPFNVTRLVSSPVARTFAAPSPGLTESAGLLVASAQIRGAGQPAGYVQFARSGTSLDATVNRIWLFLGLCVIGGTALALLAGLTVAGQAMKPIAALTELARRVERSGDPSERRPVVTTEDEVGELARTFEGMLESIEAAEAEREEVFARQRRFVADASHELRTPLTSIQLNLEMLRDGHDDEGVAASSALESTKRMSGLVSDLLLLARTGTGAPRTSERVEIPEVVISAIDEVKPIAGSHSIEMTATPCPEVDGDPDGLQRAARNLIENAIRHTPAGTVVSVSVGPSEGGTEVVVSDDGPGVPPGMTEKVFERFARAGGSADTSSVEGSGLGLAIVSAIAAQHGGRAGASNRPRGGAEFRLWLPAATAG